MARIDQSRIPPRPAGGTRGVDPVKRRARQIESLHGTDGREVRVPDGAPAARKPAAPSLVAPSEAYLTPLVGMSRDRIVASLSRIENTMARLQAQEGTEGVADEVTLARMMISEHLRRLRLVGEAPAAGPFAGVR